MNRTNSSMLYDGFPVRKQQSLRSSSFVLLPVHFCIKTFAHSFPALASSDRFAVYRESFTNLVPHIVYLFADEIAHFRSTHLRKQNRRPYSDTEAYRKTENRPRGVILFRVKNLCSSGGEIGDAIRCPLNLVRRLIH